MKKFLFMIIFLAAAGLLLMVTCPDRTAHYEAIKGVVSEVVNSEVDKNNVFSTELASISTMMAVNLTDSYLKNNLLLRDHILFNIGYIDYQGELRIVSFGILNHVFTIDKETAKEVIKDKLSLPFK
jgi:hypothetical protein